MSAYIQAYTTSPGTGRQIINEHIQKITQPLSAITGSSITPASGSKVAADILTQAAVVLSQLSAIPETSASSGCAGACSGFVLPAVILPAPAVPVHVRAVVPARAQKAVPMIALVLAPLLREYLHRNLHRVLH